MEFSNKTCIPVSTPTEAIALDATGATDTPSNLRPTLSDLARLTYVRGMVQWHMPMSASATQGDVTVSLRTAGGVSLGSQTVSLSGSAVGGEFEVDLSQVLGSERLLARVNVDSVGDASLTGNFYANLFIEHPVVIGTC